jgi:hypothetical protein
MAPEPVQVGAGFLMEIEALGMLLASAIATGLKGWRGALTTAPVVAVVTVASAFWMASSENGGEPTPGMGFYLWPAVVFMSVCALFATVIGVAVGGFVRMVAGDIRGRKPS